MKVLKLIDHTGQLMKQFNVYVEGEDFRWEASTPEPIWLGTITLQEIGVEQEEPEVIAPEEVELEDRGKEEKFLDTKVKCEKCGWEGTLHECAFGHDDYLCPTCQVESLQVIKEGKVKDEPKKRSKKGK